jgi:hypothetical protein
MMKTEKKRYLWYRPNCTENDLLIVDDPIKEVFSGNRFDHQVDKLYEIGREVKLKVTIEPVENVVYRDSYVEGTR